MMIDGIKSLAQNEDYKKLQTEVAHLKQMCAELEATNSNLVIATWRERDMKKQLKETLDELQTTKELVETQNKRITESINYSKKIQNAINATEVDLQFILPKSFILYKPKDVISGDFPWFYKKNNYLYLAAVDCTGHGVPGAMMSMIGNLLLNDITNGEENFTPAEILLLLHHSVIKTLKQDIAGNNSSDGMDVAMVRLDLITNELLFSGAHRPLFFQRNGVIEQFSGDKFPIGGVQYKGKNKFENQTFQLQKKDRIFLFSDGLPDQIGGEEGRKLMTKKIKESLEVGSENNFYDTKNVIENLFLNWKENYKQIDDVLLIGFEA